MSPNFNALTAASDILVCFNGLIKINKRRNKKPQHFSRKNDPRRESLNLKPSVTSKIRKMGPHVTKRCVRY